MNITKLNNLLSTMPSVKLLLKTLIEYQDMRERYNDSITVEAAISILKTDHEINVSRGEIIYIFQQLQDCECGRFITGRRKKQSRFQWAFNLAVFSKDFSKELKKVEDSNSKNSEVSNEEGKMTDLRHQFHLRPNYTVNFELPTDLSGNEASRLAKFIESLPMA